MSRFPVNGVLVVTEWLATVTQFVPLYTAVIPVQELAPAEIVGEFSRLVGAAKV